MGRTTPGDTVYLLYKAYVLYIIVTGFDKRNVQGFEHLPAVPVHHGLA
jgi:hypothetical protein